MQYKTFIHVGTEKERAAREKNKGYLMVKETTKSLIGNCTSEMLIATVEY